jgi:hypothetical protein
LFLSLLTSALSGCYYDSQEILHPSSTTGNCDTLNVTYNSKVLPIIQSNCYSCHSGSSLSGNVNLEGYANLKIYAGNGKLVSSITHATGVIPMPPGSKLSDCDISTIKTWMNNGSVNN